MKTLYQYKLPKGEFVTYDQLPAHAISVRQTHSNIVLEYKGDNLDRLEADGIVVDMEHYPQAILAIKTADCLPICILGAKHAAMLHAGWRGVAGKIVLHPLIHQMKPVYAFIGPSIQKNNFEVTEEFHQHFPLSKNFHQMGEKTVFDLQSEVIDQLKQAYPQIQIVDCGVCTFDSTELYSYRRDKGQSRNFNTYSY